MYIVYIIIFSLFTLLTVVTISVQFSNQPSNSNLKKRIYSWWFILGLFSLALLSNAVVFSSFLAVISFLGFKEYISEIPTRSVDRYIIFFAYLAIPLQFYLVHYCHIEMTHFIPVYMFLFIGFLAVILGETKGMLTSVAELYWGLVLTVFCISYLGCIRQFSPSYLYPAGGIGLVLYLVMLTQLNDVFQYCWGKLIGGRKILPKISPNKTVAGFLGGVVTTSFFSLFLGLLIAFQPHQAFIMGLIISIGGFLGDVLVSAVKRDLGIKDFSALIPGHGGVLDRIDSLIVSTPLFFHYLKLFHGV